MHVESPKSPTLSPFSRQELEGRKERVFRALETDEVDIVLAHTPDNVYYISGVPLLSEWGRPLWCAFRPDATGILVGAEIERENMEAGATNFDVRCYGDDQNVWDASLDLVRQFIQDSDLTPRRIALERSQLTLGLWEAIQGAFPVAELIEVGTAFAEARLIKSPEELRILRTGGEIAKVGARAFVDALQIGVSELAVASHAVSEMNRALAETWPDGLSSTYAYCQIGAHTLTPHLHASGKKLQRGDLVALNVFPVLSGYCMELERTLIVGEASDEVHRILAAVTDAFEGAKGLVAPGAQMATIDSYASQLLKDAGLGQYIRHGTGHAHGIMIGAAGREELGELRSYNERQLEAGMACSVEPGVYIHDIGGFRHSDVMLVSTDEAKCLTSFPVAPELAVG